MASRWQIVRGTNANRTGYTPLEGELIYATDTKRVWVGDGSTAGGVDPFATDPYGNIFNVKLYGAIGDGVTDDTASIQACNDAAAGGNMTFPAGTYIMDGITGASGRWTLDKDAVLKHKALSVAAYPYANNYMIRGVGDLSITGGTLDGSASDQNVRTSIVGFYGDNLRVHDCVIKNTVQEGFRIHDADTVDISNNIFMNIGEHGPSLNQDAMAVHVYNFNATGKTRVHVNDNYFVNGAPSSVAVAPVAVAITAAVGRVSESVITGNTIIGFGTSFANNYQAAIEVYKNCDNVVIADNVIHNAYSHGIRVNDSNDVLVVNNVVNMKSDANVDLACISVQARSHGTVLCSNMSVIGNIVGSTLGRGIYVGGGGALYLMTGANISDNIVTISGSNGIQVEYAAGNIIMDNNLVQNCATFGYEIRVSEGPMRISGGHIDGAGEAGIYARDTVTDLDLTIDGVSISNSTDLGISSRTAALNIFNCVDIGSPRVLDTTATSGSVSGCSWQSEYTAMPAGGNISANDFGVTFTNYGASGADGAQLPSVATVPIGFWFKFVVIAPYRFDIIPNVADRIFPTTAADGYRLRNAGDIGSSVTLEHTHADGWSIISSSGTWTDFGST